MSRRHRHVMCWCHYCDRQLQHARSGTSLAKTKDHVVPQARGGTKTVLCCAACNQLKGDMTPEQWLEFREQMPMWWALYKTENLRGVRLYHALLR